MKKSWGDFYKKNKSRLDDFDFMIRNAACHLEMFKSIYKENPKKIIEIGSGTGSMATFFSYFGIKSYSLDNDKKVLKVANELSRELKGNVEYVFGDAFAIPFKDNSFDIAYHQGLLEHFSDEEILKLLGEQLRIAKYVVLSVPNNFYPNLDFGNERLLTKEYWDKMLSNNYKLIESRNYNPVEKKTLRSRITLRVHNTMYYAKITKK